MKKILTLCIILQDSRVLLAMKKRGFGAGLFNGFGGKVEEGESIEEAARREVKEESGLLVQEMKKSGIIEFSFTSDPKILEVHIFTVTAFSGEPNESEEMKPQWFLQSEIPFAQMWSDDEYWFPYLLRGELFRGAFLFDRPSDASYSAKILNSKLQRVLHF